VPLALYLALQVILVPQVLLEQLVQPELPDLLVQLVTLVHAVRLGLQEQLVSLALLDLLVQRQQ